jgi:hypothetical protein
VCPDRAAELAAIAREQALAVESLLTKLLKAAEPPAGRSRTPRFCLEDLCCAPSLSAVPVPVREALDLLGRKLIERCPVERDESPGSAELLRELATLLSTHGPVLTEEAWAWITGSSARTLEVLVALARIDSHALEFDQMRRAMLENQVLCREVIGAAANAGS